MINEHHQPFFLSILKREKGLGSTSSSMANSSLSSQNKTNLLNEEIRNNNNKTQPSLSIFLKGVSRQRLCQSYFYEYIQILW